MLAALKAASARAHAPTRVFCDDARILSDLPGNIGVVITSPPYPNEKDYTRTTRVEAILLKLFSDKPGLRKVKESLLRSNTRNVFVKDNDSAHVKEFKSIQDICSQIEARRVELNKTSGFEKLYHKVVAHYFGGMRLHFRALKGKLRKNAKLAYVVGDQMSFLMVKIPTAALLGEIAESEGFRTLGCDLWRERIGTKVKNCAINRKTVRIREEVLLLENPE
jgi:DNA modification methylase